MATQPSNRGYVGAERPNSAVTDYNAMAFLVEQMINQTATATLVKVRAVTNAGGVTAVGQVDVTPMVHQIDGNGQAMPHGTIHQVPYCRLQGGANAVILDPQVGDIGICLFASHDISSVKATQAPALPGSRRRFDWADGLYLGGFLNGIPQQYLQFATGGITITSPQTVTINATNIAINGVVAINGNVATTGTLQNNAHNVGSTHLHTGVQTGGGNTGPPQ